MPNSALPPASALQDLLSRACDLSDESLIEVECEEETETLASSLQVANLAEPEDNGEHETGPTPGPHRQPIDHDTLGESLRKASEQVVVSGTLNEYRRLWKQFTEFCIKIQYVRDLETLDNQLDKDELPCELPDQITMWIMDKCDEYDLFSPGEPKKLDVKRHTYAHAQKMRAAISHKFGRELHHGTQPWVASPIRQGFCTGNPSISFEVSQYMISLRRRKIRGGQVVTSARAITEATIRELWQYNMAFEDKVFGVIPRKRKAGQPSGDNKPVWATKSVRIMLHVVYTIAFLCLMRFDEALRLQWHWITLERHAGSARLKIELPWRKTHQIGGIAPFYLYPNRDKPWLDPIAAYSQWVVCNKGMQLMGFLIRRKVPSGRFSEVPDHGMSADSFLDCFRNNLLDVRIDPSPYGTHSFRRGGCQYLASSLRWDIRRICSWGGWSDNQDTSTIFKYLLSWTDDSMDREDFFNPAKQHTDPCHTCGRSCMCA